MTLLNKKTNQLETTSNIESLENSPLKEQILKEVKMAVFVACNLKEDFTGSELFGGICNWSELSINSLMEYHLKKGKDEEAAKKASGIDIGKILKKVLVESEQEFELIENDGEDFRGRFNPNIYRLKK